MTGIERIQPEGLPDTRPMGFSTVVAATGARHVHVSGQVAVDVQGRLVGEGDLTRQTRQVLANLRTALEAASATLEDLVKLTIFVVDLEPSMRAQILAVRNEFIDAGKAPASTLVGVSSLVAPGFLIEIEAVAVTAS